jgi:hypothetical protein
LPHPRRFAPRPLPHAGEVYKAIVPFALCLTTLILIPLPAFASWDSFQIINWMDRDAAQLRTLRQLGVTGQKIMADRDGTGVPLERQTPAPRAAGLRWYIENSATDFYSSYHRYTPGQPVNWRFLAAQQRLLASPDDPAAIFRDPSLLDPLWRARIRDRLIATVTQQRSNNPLFYSLGDETGIADLSAFWDFDLSPASVDAFQRWLRRQYQSLAALNAEWNTSFVAWSAVRPETTREAMRRTDENFAAWNDFKAWMDTSFADALRFGTDSIHQADPHGLSAIEGIQISGWGGYDYTKLAYAVDILEGGDDLTRSIILSINPNVTTMITSGAATPDSVHAIWSAVLHGAHGLILWDAENSIVNADASPGPGAAVYAPLFGALRGEIGRVMIAARPIRDSVAVLYAPVSFRVRWMLDHRADGDAWMHRSAEIELEDNAWRRSPRDYVDALRRMGLQPRFITPAQLAKGPPAEAFLILPDAIALSDAELAAIRSYRGTVIADAPPGQFDEHGRRRVRPSTPVRIVPLADLTRVLSLVPAFTVNAPENDVDAWLFSSSGQRLLALQRRERGRSAETVTVDLHAWHARDIVTERDLGQGVLTLEIDPTTPTFLELRR